MEGFFNNMNSAVLRSVLGRMSRQEFEECMEFVKQKALELPEGTRRQMFVSLFDWCRNHKEKGFPKRDPSLFN